MLIRSCKYARHKFSPYYLALQSYCSTHWSLWSFGLWTSQKVAKKFCFYLKCFDVVTITRVGGILSPSVQNLVSSFLDGYFKEKIRPLEWWCPGGRALSASASFWLNCFYFFILQWIASIFDLHVYLIQLLILDDDLSWSVSSFEVKHIGQQVYLLVKLV